MADKECPKCGQMYSDTYRRCPFCEEKAAIERGKRLRRGGKRSAKRQRSSNAFSIMMLLAAVIVVGVLGYVFFGDQIASLMGIRPGEDVGDQQSGGQVDPLGSGGQQDGQPDDQQPDGQQPDGRQPDDQQGGQVAPPDDGGQEGPDSGVDQPDPQPLTLESPREFTIPAGETGRISVSGGAGEIVWASSNPEIATVDGGAVTGVAGGTVTITATAGEESVSCTVTITGDPWVSPVEFKLNKTDVTISQQWPDPITLKVTGGEYTSISWSSSDTNVATVSSGGLVTRVGKGVATITVVVDGHTLTCIVRCTF